MRRRIPPKKVATKVQLRTSTGPPYDWQSGVRRTAEAPKEGASAIPMPDSTPDNDPLIARFRERWKNTSVYGCTAKFEDADERGRGSGVKKVRLAEGLVAWAKPAFNRRASHVPDAAHEFIASELAVMLGVHVPPVRLWMDSDGSRYALSIRAFPESLPWSLMKPVLTTAQHHALRPTFSKSLVFHAWIANSDRNDENVLVDGRGSPLDTPKLAFIDHSQSLSFDPSVVRGRVQMPYPYYVREADVCPKTIAAQLERVHAISKEARNVLISLIPEKFLPSGNAELILAGLEQRRVLMRSAFAGMLGGIS